MTDISSRGEAGPAAISKSERRVLGLVFQRQALIQNTLMEEMELTQQSVSRLVGGMIERGLLCQGERISSGKRGSPSISIRIRPDYTASAGLAIAVDSLTLTIIDFAGNSLGERRTRLPAMTLDAVMAWTNATLDDLTRDLGLARGGLTGLGVSVAGSFVGDAVGFNTPRDLDHWANIDVAEVFAQGTGLPAWSDNDGNLAALAESVNGVGRWARSFAYLYLGAGVGGGIVLDGVPWRGRCGNAGEFAGGLPPDIFPFPNLELLRRMLARDGVAFDTVQAMVEGYDPSWPAIEGWITSVRDSVSIIASNATAILDLEAIVLGGLLPRDLAERLIPQVVMFDQKRRAQPRPTARLVPSEIEGNAAAIGAAMLPLRATYFR